LLALLYLLSILLIKLRCVITRDFLDLSLIISIPRNSLISPKLLTSSLEVVTSSLCRLFISSRFFANTSISSTCIARTIGLFKCIKIELSILRGLKPIVSSTLVKCSCYCLLACLRPYKALFNLQAILL
jgi:hypothetical protein